MKRKLIAFSMSLALLLSVFSAANVGAHTAYIEALNPTNPNGPTPNRGEWFGALPTTGIGAVQRDDTLRGEFVYNDAPKDQRLITPPSGTTKITKEVDLNWFSVTADANNLYMLAKVDVYCCITNNPALELMVAIDTTHTSGTGTRLLPNVLGASGSTVGISVTADAAWEYVVDAKFANGVGGSAPPYVTTTPKIYTNLTTSTNCTITTPGCGAQLVSTNGNFAEVSIPWSAIGGKPTGGSYLRFSVATLYSNHATAAAPDTATSPIMDVIDDGSQNTEQDLQDRTINTSFDVHFDPINNEEVYTPLQITEFQPNPFLTDNPGPTNPSTDSEWIEINNPNAFAIPLSDYKIGNAAKHDTGATASQGMFKFKAATIAANSTIIVARFKSRFLAGNPPVPVGVPIYGLDGLDATHSSNADFTRYTPWANGPTIDLDNTPGVPPAGVTNPSLEEQVVLLDGKDGIVDLVNYGTPPAPTAGNIPVNIVSVPEGVSFERCPGTRDTNGGWKANSQTQLTNNIEFIPKGAGTNLLETPGTVCQGIPGIDLQVSKNGPVTADKGDTIQYTITYGNYGANPEPGNVVVTDTLPIGITFTNLPENALPVPLSVNGQTLTWNFAGLPGNTTGTIVLTGTINLDVAPSTQLVNRVGISSTNEQADKQGNNLGTQTVTTLGPPVLGVTLSGLSSVLPGKQFSYNINYNNTGGNEANDVTITGTIPAGVTLNGSAAAGATSNFSTPVVGPATVSWTVSQLASNTNGVITVNATVGSNVAVDTSLAFSASASSDDPVVGVTAGPVNGSLKVGFLKLYLPLMLR